jgi:DNA-binding SARP family transcriptional activator
VAPRDEGATRGTSDSALLDAVGSLDLCVLGTFAVRCDGDAITIASTGQRVLAGLAVHGRSALRSRLAEMLWPDSAPDRAIANLRCAIWRMPDVVRSSLHKHGQFVALGPRWRIDLDEATAGAQQLRNGASPAALDHNVFAFDLLPDWDESWLMISRERHRQLRLHALEELAAQQLQRGQSLDAADTALHAVATDPLRESAQSLLVRAHLACGNRAAAWQQYERFRILLADELGVEPGPELAALVPFGALQSVR